MALPDVHYGSAAAKPLNWRDKRLDDKTPDDDEELAKTPEDVKRLVGFDPLELNRK